MWRWGVGWGPGCRLCFGCKIFMELFFHTIAVEPARWTAQRVSRKLVELLPEIAGAGFRQVEVFEPHLGMETVSGEIRDALKKLGMTPEVLSSYLNLNPVETSDGELKLKTEELRERVEFYGFPRMRLFPGPKMDPNDRAGVKVFMQRLTRLTEALPDTEILLETHDGSIADDPEAVAQVVRDLNAPNLGLLYQPTLFPAEAALKQFAIQQPYIRHVHLQNRNADLTFARMREGIVPWAKILGQLPPGVTGSLEFVPVGICTVEEFDLGAALEEARAEAGYVAEIWK
jgi:sugar phosphate isomerase/epimerase